MIVLSGALVLVALVLLVFGALDRNLPYVYASIGVSVLSLLLLCVGILQRRGELADDQQDEAPTPVTDTPTEPVPALVGAGEEQARDAQAEGRTAELARPVPAPVPAAAGGPVSRRIVPDAAPVEDTQDDRGPQDDRDPQGDVEPDAVEEDLVDEELPDEDPSAEEDVDEDLAEAEDDEGSGVTVLVVSGRPRYHLEGCRVLRGKEPQPLDRDDARTHGFSPCGVCKPDADETAAAQQSGAGTAQTGDGGHSSLETVFGGPLFADPSSDHADSGRTGELPDRPVQPTLRGVDPSPDPATVDEAVEPPAELRGDDAAGDPVLETDGEAAAELRGDDPADDPALETDGEIAADPSPDVAADPDELVTAPEPEVAADPDELVGTPEPEVAEPTSIDGGVAEVDPGSPVPEPVVVPPADEPEVPADEAEAPSDEPEVREAVEEVPARQVPAAAVAAPEEPVEAAPARTRASSRKAAVGPARTGRSRSSVAQGGSRAEDASAATAAVGSAPGRKAVAKAAPGKKAVAKAAPAEKRAAKAAPAKKARAQAAAAPPAAPQVQRPLVRAVRPDALRLGAPSTGVTITRVSARAAAPATGASVVVVPDRDRFHRPECRFVRDAAGATKLPKASASRQGYAACGVCKP